MKAISSRTWTLAGLVAINAALVAHGLWREPAAAVFVVLSAGLVWKGVLGRAVRVAESEQVFGVDRVAVIASGILCVVWTGSNTVGQSRTVAFGVLALVGVLVVIAYLNTDEYAKGRRWTRFALVALVVLIGVITIGVSSGDDIDVFVFQDMGTRYLMAGQNPYTAEYPNIYSEANTRQFYGEGLADEHGLRFGFPYTPMSLLLAVPGGVLAGDYRFGLLAAVAVVILIITSPANGTPGRVAGSLLAVFPLHFGLGGILEGGWTEPFLVFLLAIVALAVARGSGWTPWLFGLFLASKLTLVVVAPTYLLVDRPLFGAEGTWRRICKVGLAGAVATLPLALWDWPRFWFSVVELQFLQPFREDALSLTVWFGSMFGTPDALVVTLLPLVVAAVALVVVFRHPDRSAAGLATACGFVSLCWLVFTKQSFVNHYYFAVGALILGLAFSNRIPEERANASAATKAAART